MYLKEQTYVCTLAETGNISKAADQLYITQPALSTYISNLEQSLGVQLFVKVKNKLVLTYMGERYVEKAREMLRLQDEFNLELSLYGKGVTGRIRIGVQSRRSPFIVADLICFFKQNHPNIEIVFEEGDISTLEKLIEENRLDLIIYTCLDRKSNLVYERIKEDKILVAINSLSSLRSKTIWNQTDKYPWINIEDIKDETLILPHKGQSLRDICELLFKSENFKPEKIIEIKNIETIITMVSRNLGVGFNRESYADNMNVYNVMYLNIKQDKTPSELVIAYTKNSSRIPNFMNIVESIKTLLLNK
ncbi:MAG: LysR family transcriptional regulator [Sedimentibacter sp.]|uniref:LysR family transcriptional regulator n=1 Tax=Sedimentibacter sp. TaxID=1960295 RepID=UPI00315912D3